MQRLQHTDRFEIGINKIRIRKIFALDMITQFLIVLGTLCYDIKSL